MKNLWSEQDINYLKEHYYDVPLEDLIKTLGRSKIAIYSMATKLQLKKNDDWKILAAENVIKIGANSRFKKGSVPANKGKKMAPELKEKMKHTFFKKGNEPHNTGQDGDISIRKMQTGVSYKWIRISKANWQLLHRVVWVEHYGTIPKSHNVQFIDGNTMNCDISNLELISRQHQAQFNNHNIPRELREVLLLKQQLNKKIESYGKEHNQ